MINQILKRWASSRLRKDLEAAHKALKSHDVTVLELRASLEQTVRHSEALERTNNKLKDDLAETKEQFALEQAALRVAQHENNRLWELAFRDIDRRHYEENPDRVPEKVPFARES